MSKELDDASIRAITDEWGLDDEAVAAIERLLVLARLEAVTEAFRELRATPKDSWYGTMPEIVGRLTTMLEKPA